MTTPSGSYLPAAPIVPARPPSWILVALGVLVLTVGAYFLGADQAARTASGVAQRLRDSAAVAQVTIARRDTTIAQQTRALIAQRAATDTAVQHARAADRALQGARAQVQVATPTTLVVRADTAPGAPADTVTVPALVVQRIQAADAARDSSARALILARSEVAGLRVHVDTMAVQNQALQAQVDRWTRTANAERDTGAAATRTAWVKGALTGGAVGLIVGAVGTIAAHVVR